MKRKACQVLLISGILAFAAGAQESSKEAKINRLLSITANDAMFKQSFDQMEKTLVPPQAVQGQTPEQRARAQEQQTKALNVIKTLFTGKDFRRTLVQAYNEAFSEQEIDGILAFYESPAGRAMTQKLPQIMMKVMVSTQAQMRPE